MAFDLLPNQSRPFVLPSQEGKPDALRFQLRTLSSRAVLELQAVDNTGDMMFALVCAGLCGIEGELVRDGEPVAFVAAGAQTVAGCTIAAGGAPVDLVESFPADLVAVLATEITERNTLDHTSLGN